MTSEAAERGPLRPPWSVLIVDDDRWTTRALDMVLSGLEDFTVLPPVHSGEAAVQSYREQHPDVVLMDINMPGVMNGIDATAGIRALDPAAAVVVLSTISPGPGLARALEAGAIAAVNKTASDDTLSDVIRSAARGDDPRLMGSLAADILITGEPLPRAPLLPSRPSAKEVEVLRMVCQGCGYEEIAAALHLSVWTVKSHTRSLREKLQAENLAQLVVRALQYNYYSA